MPPLSSSIPSIAALRRELLRNGQLRDLCGFDPFAGAAAVPTECAYSRFQRRLRKYQPQMEELFQSTLDDLQIELPDLGQVQALDGKELHSLAKVRAAIHCRRMTPGKTTTGAATGMPIGASRARARRNATGSATCCT